MATTLALANNCCSGSWNNSPRNPAGMVLTTISQPSLA